MLLFGEQNIWKTGKPGNAGKFTECQLDWKSVTEFTKCEGGSCWEQFVSGKHGSLFLTLILGLDQCCEGCHIGMSIVVKLLELQLSTRT